MDVQAAVQLVSNLGLAVILAAGFLYVARDFVVRAMPAIAEANAKTLAETRQQFVTALADQRRDLLLLVGEQREEVNRVLTAIVGRLERIDGDVTAIRKVVEHKQ